MPDEPGKDKDARDEALEREIEELEAELAKAAGVEGPRDPGTEGTGEQGTEGNEGNRRGFGPASDTSHIASHPSQEPGMPSEQEIAARLERKIKEAEDYLGPMQSRFDLEDIPEDRPEPSDKPDVLDPELRSRVDKFSDRVELIRGRRVEEERARKRSRELESDAAKGLGLGLTVAYMIIGLPLAGAFFGWLADNATGSKSWTGAGVLIGAVLGVLAAIAIMNRANRN